MKTIRFKITQHYTLKAILIFSIILVLCDLSFAFKAPINIDSGSIGLPLSGRQGKKRLKEKYPSKEQLQAAKGVGVIEWSKITGGPKFIEYPQRQPSQESPEAIAWRFLEEKKALYGIKDPHTDLTLEESISDEYATSVHFRQMYKGIPLMDALSVSVLPNGVISSINGEYYADIEVDPNPTISAQKAKHTAALHRKKYEHHSKYEPNFEEYPEIKDSSEPELLIWPTGDKDYLFWHFTGKGGWEYYVDAHDGVIRGALSPLRNITGFTNATGYLLMPPNLADNKVTFRLYGNEDFFWGQYLSRLG